MKLFVRTDKQPYGEAYYPLDSLEPIKLWAILSKYGDVAGTGDTEEQAWANVRAFYRSDPFTRAEEILILPCEHVITTGCDCACYDPDY